MYGPQQQSRRWIKKIKILKLKIKKKNYFRFSFPSAQQGGGSRERRRFHFWYYLLNYSNSTPARRILRLIIIIITLFWSLINRRHLVDPCVCFFVHLFIPFCFVFCFEVQARAIVFTSIYSYHIIYFVLRGVCFVERKVWSWPSFWWSSATRRWPWSWKTARWFTEQ